MEDVHAYINFRLIRREMASDLKINEITAILLANEAEESSSANEENDRALDRIFTTTIWTS